MQNVSKRDSNVLELNTASSFDSSTPHNSNASLPLHKRKNDNQEHNYQKTFNKAIRKQQQLFTICNTLERQNQLLQEFKKLLNSNKGALWLDAQIKEFNSLCPSNILKQLSKPYNTSIHKVEHSEIIHLNFFNLINEIFYIPLNALATITTGTISEHERKGWYEWCLKIDRQLLMFKVQIISAQAFFSVKSFDKICNLAKDGTTQQQLGNIKHLFQQQTSPAENVECNGEFV